MRIAINLIWLKPRAMGGVETFVRYLLTGFERMNISSEFIILVNSKAYDYLKEWGINGAYEIVTTEDVDPFNVTAVFFYQYLEMGIIAKKLKVDLLYHPTPIYPIRKIDNVKQVVTFHDLLFLHYPQYATCFQRIKYMWSWKQSLKNADKIVAISNFTKNDIVRSFRIGESKIEVIYNPIVLPENCADFSKLAYQFAVEPKNYFYTISSLLPHKNTETLVKMMKLIMQNSIRGIPHKLLISGTGKIQGSNLERMINELGLNRNVIFTGFVTEEEKRSLIENCYCFLFPSLFEGFGMPPVESLMLGIPVIASKLSSIVEITQNMADYYVEKLSDEKEWLRGVMFVSDRFVARESVNNSNPQVLKQMYNTVNIACQYIKIFSRLLRKQEESGDV